MFQVSLDHAERAEYTIFFLHFEALGFVLSIDLNPYAFRFQARKRLSGNREVQERARVVPVLLCERADLANQAKPRIVVG